MPAQASADAAAITSAYRVLITYAPASASVLDAERTRTLAAIPDGMAKLMGMQVGEAAAQAVLALRANDGSSTPVPYTPTCICPSRGCQLGARSALCSRESRPISS
jgi:hypothetical protein